MQTEESDDDSKDIIAELSESRENEASKTDIKRVGSQISKKFASSNHLSSDKSFFQTDEECPNDISITLKMKKTLPLNFNTTLESQPILELKEDLHTNSEGL